MNNIILEVKEISKHFTLQSRSLAGQKEKATVKAVDGVSFQLEKGKTLGVVGESGCGKTTLMRTIMRLIDVSSGEIIFNGEEVTSKKGKNLMNLRRNMQIVFQDPTSSLNPMMVIKDIIAEPLVTHTKIRGTELQQKVGDLLEMVGLSRDHIWRRPHEFSGGQSQRIAIARALALNPDVVVLDEPTASLDVSVQALILQLLDKLQKELNLTYVFVTHDLSVAKIMSDDLMVMYLGKTVEKAPVDKIFDNPLHPYTGLLMKSIPSPVPEEKLSFDNLLEGGIPSAINRPAGCSFHPRCPRKFDRCEVEEPQLLPTDDGRQVSCHLYHKKKTNPEVTVNEQ